MDKVKVTLGGVEYEIAPLPIKPSREWRQKLAGPVGELMSILQDADSIQLTEPKDLARLITLAKKYIVEAPDLFLELLYEYSPDLKKARKKIEETAYDPEVMEAFIEVLKLAYPFGQLVSLLRNRG